MEYKVNPNFKKVLPPLSEPEYKNLYASLSEQGYKGAPIQVWQGYIVDGHNRYKICQELQIDCPAEEIAFASENDVIIWIIKSQLSRRNMNAAQKILSVLQYKDILKSEAKERQRQGGRERGKICETESESDHRIKEKSGKTDDSPAEEKETQESGSETTGEKLTPTLAQAKCRNSTVDEQLAEIAGVGKETLRKCRKVLESTAAGLKAEMLDGSKSINAAYNDLVNNGQSNDMDRSVELSPFQIVSDDERFDNIRTAYNDSIGQIESLLSFDFVSQDGEKIESVRSDIEGLLELAYELRHSLDGMTCINGIIQLAANDEL